MSNAIDAKLAALGITLPEPFAPIANYVPFTISDKLVTISGQLPIQNGQITQTGKLGGGVSVAAGQAAARHCAINLIAQLKAATGGDLSRVKRVLRLGGFIAATADFTEHATVMNGASDLAVDVFGEAGRHARSTIGVASLPRDASVEVEGLFEIG